jgi:hypothetical protein
MCNDVAAQCYESQTDAYLSGSAPDLSLRESVISVRERRMAGRSPKTVDWTAEGGLSPKVTRRGLPDFPRLGCDLRILCRDKSRAATSTNKFPGCDRRSN